MSSSFSPSSLLSSSIFIDAASGERDYESFSLGAKANLLSSKIEDEQYDIDFSADNPEEAAIKIVAASGDNCGSTFYDLSFDDTTKYFNELLLKHGRLASKEEIATFFKEKKCFNMRGLVINTLVKYFSAFNTPGGIKSLWESDRGKKKAAKTMVGVFEAPRGNFKRILQPALSSTASVSMPPPSQAHSSILPPMMPYMMPPHMMPPYMMPPHMMPPHMMPPHMMPPHMLPPNILPHMMPPRGSIPPSDDSRGGSMPPHMPYMYWPMQHAPISPSSSTDSSATPHQYSYHPYYSQYFQPLPQHVDMSSNFNKKQRK